MKKNGLNEPQKFQSQISCINLERKRRKNFMPSKIIREMKRIACTGRNNTVKLISRDILNGTLVLKNSINHTL